jgi:pyruvate,water dikinase
MSEPSDELWQSIIEAYRELGDRAGRPDLLVAVRSSALDEDSGDSSFAGQHATYLGVRGEAALRDAVVGCLESARTPAALAYRAARGLEASDARMAILVQHLVEADAAAVAFTRNPVTGNPEEVVINATWGLGEPLVSGTVTPDTYLVDAVDFALISQVTADKPSMCTIDADGRVVYIEVPQGRRRTPALTPEQALAIARLACDLEARMGWPADIECAYKDGELYLLQCRPITT